MLMTANEKIKMLNMLDEAKKLNDEKTNLVQEILYLAKNIADQNAMLTRENELLRRQLEIAENYIMKKDN